MTELKQNFWAITYKQNIAKLTGICYRYVRSRQIAEDLAHDAFLVAINKAADFKGEGHFDAWLRKIAVNEALQYLRGQKKKEYHNEWIQYENENMASNEEIYGMDFTEEELLDAINQLPEHHKLVFNLFVIDKFSHAEIANELGISEGTSKSHLARARKKIRTLLLEKEKKKSRIFLFLLPVWVRNIDRTYQKVFNDFEIKPGNLLHPDIIAARAVSIPEFNLYPLLSKGIIKSGIAFGSIAISLFTVTILLESETHLKQYRNSVAHPNVAKLLAGNETITNIEDSAISLRNRTNKTNNILNDVKNSDSASATISDNSIITDEKNLNNTEMRALNTVSALLLAGASMGFDSSKNQGLKFNPGLKLPEVQFQEKKNEVEVKRKEGEGTFNASKISWSSKNHHVYMKGIGMKAKFEKDKFNATGTVSFLGEVYYLLIDGEEVPHDKDIKLSDGDYSVKSLSIQQATQKYGEKGKNGAVEIAKL